MKKKIIQKAVREKDYKRGLKYNPIDYLYDHGYKERLWIRIRKQYSFIVEKKFLCAFL